MAATVYTFDEMNDILMDRDTRHTQLAERVQRIESALSDPPPTAPPPALEPSPSPAPEPPSAPPPAGLVWTSAEVDRAIQSSTGLNEAKIAYVSGNGWKRGGSVAMGSQWRNRGMPSWAPRGPWPDDFWWRFFYWWAVLFNEEGNQYPGWVEVKDLDWQIRYRGGAFERILPMSSNVGWGELFNRDLTHSTGVAITQRAGLDGGVSIQMPGQGSPHFVNGNSGTQVPRPEDIDGVMASVTHRIDPRGDQRMRALCDVGGDPKPSRGGQSQDGVPWYPGFGVSRAERVGTDWRRTVIVNVLGGIDQPAGRCITQQSLRDNPPLN